MEEGKYISLRTATRLIIIDDRPVSYSTVWRWVRTRRLRAVQVGGRLVTTREWVEAAVQPARPTSPRSRGSSGTRLRLQRLGWG